jgi:hypothetical protein
MGYDRHTHTHAHAHTVKRSEDIKNNNELSLLTLS